MYVGKVNYFGIKEKHVSQVNKIVVDVLEAQGHKINAVIYGLKHGGYLCISEETFLKSHIEMKVKACLQSLISKLKL